MRVRPVSSLSPAPLLPAGRSRPRRSRLRTSLALTAAAATVAALAGPVVPPAPRGQRPPRLPARPVASPPPTPRSSRPRPSDRRSWSSAVRPPARRTRSPRPPPPCGRSAPTTDSTSRCRRTRRVRLGQPRPVPRRAATTTAAGPSTPAWAAPRRSFAETDFRDHLRGALAWTTRHARGPTARPPSPPTTRRAAHPAQPARPDRPDRRAARPGHRAGRHGCFYIGRGGAASSGPVVTDWNDPDVGKGCGTDPLSTTRRPRRSPLADRSSVFGNKGGGDELVKNEEGLLGIELDPDFAHNGWVYLHYTPHESIDRDTRIGGAAPSPGSPTTSPRTSSTWAPEKVLLHWPVQIHSCCHAGGGMAWDSKGNLYIAPVTTTPPASATVTPATTRSRTTRASRSPTPAAPRATPTTSTARSCGSTRRPTAPTPSPRATSSPARSPTRAAARPAARST